MTNSAIIFSDVNQPFVQTGMEFVKSISIAQKKIPLWFAVFPNSPSHKPKQSKKSKMKSNPECVFFWPGHVIGLYFTNELIWKFLCCDWPVWNPLTCYYQIWGWTVIRAFTRRDARMFVLTQCIGAPHCNTNVSLYTHLTWVKCCSGIIYGLTKDVIHQTQWCTTLVIDSMSSNSQRKGMSFPE